MVLFPFDNVREGQKEFMEDVEYAVKNKKNLLAHAPTGIGKTAAVIGGSLSYAIENNKYLFFLTPKHTQHTIVIDTLRRIKEKYREDIVSVDIIGKQWMCLYKGVRDLTSRDFNEFCKVKKKNEECEYYKKSHSSKRKRIIEEVKDKIMHNEEIIKICSKEEVCPYEICVQAANSANVIVCDYFHIFSGSVREAFLSRMDKRLEDSIIIVDEAHNLPDRIRMLYTYSLSEHSLRAAEKEARMLNDEDLENKLYNINKILKSLDKKLDKKEKETKNEKKEIYIKRESLIEAIEENLKVNYDDLFVAMDYCGEEILKIPNRYRSYLKIISKFLENWKKDEPGFARILKNENGKYFLNYRCLDPSISSKKIFSACHASILMSGTLTPIKMYSDLLELEDTIEKEYESPFPKENKLVLIVKGLTTKYENRSDKMYERYAEEIAKILIEVPKNAAVFFPSYSILESISLFLKKMREEKKFEKEILVEKKEMKKEDRLSLYERLVQLKNRGAVLLAVSAGSMSEGLDYANNLLDSVIIVGLPLDIPDLETKSLIEYYDLKFNNGWNYGYIYPAMNKAIQAAGRCIRSETDRGAIILMDERFKWKNYLKCLPKDFNPIITSTPEIYIRKFFK